MSFILSGLEDGKPLEIKITAVDDDTNFKSEQTFAVPQDTLPLAPIEFSILPLPPTPNLVQYSSVSFTLFTTSLINMDGSPKSSLVEGLTFRLFHGFKPLPNRLKKDDGLITTPLAFRPLDGTIYNIQDPVDFLVVAEDPSLDEIDLLIDKMGYRPRGLVGFG